MAEHEIDAKGLRQRCQACGQVNRIPLAKLGTYGKCGKCGAAIGGPISAPADVLDEAAFDAMLRDSPIPIVVDFWAPWCGPCRMVAPELDKVAASAAGRWLIAKVNTQALPRLGARLGVQSIPTMAVYRGGQELRREAGARPAPAIERFITGALS